MNQQLNFTSVKELSMIEYPGYIKNIDNMVETLGGAFKISQVVCGDVKKLDLRYHSRNPFNKAIIGEMTPRMGFLISVCTHKLTKKKKAKVVWFEIVGYSRNCVVFNSLGDFQYLPLNKNTSATYSEYAFNALVPRSVINTAHFSDPFDHLFCIPNFFARADSFKCNIFRNNILDNGHNEILGVQQKSAVNNRDVVVFNMLDPIPLQPDPQVVKRMKIKYISDYQLEKVKALFERCPIWTRVALLYESGISDDKLKCIVPSLAFHYSTGPWRRLYVRFGYDPRKEFYSRYYQTFDFRIRFRSGVAELVEKRKETIKKDRGNFSEDIVQGINYPYLEENKLPRSRQCILRYCDIRIPKIQAMLDKIPTPITGAKCNERTGWLPPGFDGQVRQVLSYAIKDVIRKHYRK